jgi:hypothetical protein
LKKNVIHGDGTLACFSVRIDQLFFQVHMMNMAGTTSACVQSAF